METAIPTVEGLRIFEWRNLVLQAFTCLSHTMGAGRTFCFGVEQLAARVAEIWPLIHASVKVPDPDLLEHRLAQFLESDPSSFVGTEYGEGERRRVLWYACAPLTPPPSLLGVREHFAPRPLKCVPAESQAADSLLALAFAEPYQGSGLPSPAPSLVVSPNRDGADPLISPCGSIIGADGPALSVLLAGCPPGTDDGAALAWLASLPPDLALDAVADPHERACPEALLPSPYGYGKLALLLAHPAKSLAIANALRAVRLRAYANADVKSREEVLEQYSWQGCLGSEITVKKVAALDARVNGACALNGITHLPQSPPPPPPSPPQLANGATQVQALPADDAVLSCLFRVENVLHNVGRQYAPVAALSQRNGYPAIAPGAKNAPQKKPAPRCWPTRASNVNRTGGRATAAGAVKSCTNCGTDTTSAWRRCPDDGSLLCNSCGLYYKTYKRHRPNKDSEPPVKVKRTRVADSRRCGRCGTAETPVWRRGTQHETLCNACGLQMREHDLRRPVTAADSGATELVVNGTPAKRCRPAKRGKATERRVGDPDLPTRPQEPPIEVMRAAVAMGWTADGRPALEAGAAVGEDSRDGLTPAGSIRAPRSNPPAGAARGSLGAPQPAPREVLLEQKRVE